MDVGAPPLSYIVGITLLGFHPIETDLLPLSACCLGEPVSHYQDYTNFQLTTARAYIRITYNAYKLSVKLYKIAICQSPIRMLHATCAYRINRMKTKGVNKRRKRSPVKGAAKKQS